MKDDPLRAKNAMVYPISDSTNYIHECLAMQIQTDNSNTQLRPNEHWTNAVLCFWIICRPVFLVFSFQEENSLFYIHSLILDISIAPLQVHYNSEALPTTALILHRS